MSEEIKNVFRDLVSTRNINDKESPALYLSEVVWIPLADFEKLFNGASLNYRGFIGHDTAKNDVTWRYYIEEWKDQDILN